MSSTSITDTSAAPDREAASALVAGVHHIAVLTQDLDRLTAFYEEVLGLHVWLELSEEGMRHVMVDLGGGASLHVFEQPDNPHSAGDVAMFGRGHLDHVALMAPDEAAFDALRHRLVEVGASDGVVVDFGAVREITFQDPDGHRLEIALAQPGAAPLTFDQRIIEPYGG